MVIKLNTTMNKKVSEFVRKYVEEHLDKSDQNKSLKYL